MARFSYLLINNHIKIKLNGTSLRINLTTFQLPESRFVIPRKVDALSKHQSFTMKVYFLHHPLKFQCQVWTQKRPAKSYQTLWSIKFWKRISFIFLEVLHLSKIFWPEKSNRENYKNFTEVYNFKGFDLQFLNRI